MSNGTAASKSVDAVLQEVSSRLRLLYKTAESCFHQIDDAGLWHRPTPNGNAIGNLGLHLAGSLRMLIVNKIGGRLFQRDRAAEFAARGGMTREQVLGALRDAIEEACAVIEGLPAEKVADPISLFGADRPIASALILVVAHTGLHVGQIQLMTRNLIGESYRETWASPPAPGAPAR